MRKWSDNDELDGDKLGRVVSGRGVGVLRMVMVMQRKEKEWWMDDLGC